MPTFYDLMKYSATGIASPDMTAWDKTRTLAIGGVSTVQTLTGIPPMSFKADGTPLISWSMKGNGSQTRTPTPDEPIIPTFCGKLAGSDWAIPITCAGQTTPVYLGQTQTVRRVKKLELTGQENWIYTNTYFRTQVNGYLREVGKIIGISTHYIVVNNQNQASLQNGEMTFLVSSSGNNYMYINDADYSIVDNFKAYLAAQYAAGTPVTIWYVLAEPETGIVNEPLAKIGDYADELSNTDAAVTIPTAKGQNTLTVDTELQPFEMTITYKG